MKRPPRLFICLTLFIFISGQSVCGATGNAYQQHINQAKIALKKQQYPRAMFYIHSAHFADPSKEEPLALLSRIPSFSIYEKSVRYYYELASEHYNKGDFESAWFYYKVAYAADPSVEGLIQMVDHSEKVLSGVDAPRVEVHKDYRTWYAASPVVVTSKDAERVRGQRYVVNHPPEVDAIIQKYQPQADKKNAAITRAFRKAATEPRDEPLEIRKSDRIKRTPTAPVSPPVSKKFITKIEKKVAKPVTKKKVVNGNGHDIRGLFARLIGKKPTPEVQADSGAAKTAEESLNAIRHSFRIKKKVGGVKTSEEIVPKPKYEPSYAADERKKVEIRNVEKKALLAANIDTIEVKDTIELDDDLWDLQPGTVLEVAFGESILLRGRQVERFLIFNPDIISVQKKDKDNVIVTVNRRGTTLFHLWDETGRWTFNVKGIIPEIRADRLRSREDEREKHVRPFRISYSNNWNSFYLGNSMSNLDRMNLTFSQRVAISGGTPYGFFDASANFYKFALSTENTGRAMGLSNANWGPFENFTIRGWDTSANFSLLSLPGRSFRGALFDSFSFDRQIRYTLLRGQDRATFITVSDGDNIIRKTYIEGVRITLWPDQKHQYSVNYARGWGEDRQAFLRDKVFSFEARNRFGKYQTHFEWAYDEEDSARILFGTYKSGDLAVRANFRDIQKGFTTVISKPTGRGEVGGNFMLDYRPEAFQLSSNLDIYRDREFFNPTNKDGVNFDFGANIGVPLSDTLKWNSSVYYTDTSQLISPRESFRVNSSISKEFDFLGKFPVTTYFSGNYQMTRYDFTPSSEFDVYSLGAGIRFPIFKDINFYSNYNYSWVETIETGEKSKPNVHNTGISYHKNFGNYVSTRVSVAYRNEENTEGTFSFLSGTDALRANMGVSYRPTPDIEFFLDGSARNVLTENASEAAFNDFDLRVGMRTDWDTIFRWDPSAVIQGIVYKDLNRNSRHDEDEPGIEDIEIQIGRKTVKSNSDGYYTTKVRAKAIKMGIDFASVPKGYTLMNYLRKDIEIRNKETYNVNFGFITRTGIFGIVFIDENRNGKYDEGEKTIPGTRIKMDNQEIAVSGFEGIYNFYDIKAGQHILSLDINSLPIEYIPLIKPRHKISVQEGTVYPLHIPLKRK